MRKNTHDDADDHLPSLRADDRDDELFETSTSGQRGREAVYSRSSPVIKVKAPMSGALWALCGALTIALVGLGWWSYQQISLLERQLVATQESFARISEDAAGRLQAISGKFASSESTVNSGNQALQSQVQQLQAALDEQSRQQQQGVEGVQSGLAKRLEQAQAQAVAQATAQQAQWLELQAQLKALAADSAALKGVQAAQAKLEGEINGVSGDVAALKKASPTARLGQIEDDLLVVKSQLDNRPVTPNAANAAEFDAFRGQVTRNVTTLQSQVQNLQQQINARPK